MGRAGAALPPRRCNIPNFGGTRQKKETGRIGPDPQEWAAKAGSPSPHEVNIGEASTRRAERDYDASA